jgi:steroid delta-isomerase-like uncharacterized protein
MFRASERLFFRRHTMTTQIESNKALVGKLFAAWDAHDVEAAASLVAENIVNHAAIPEAQGRAGFRVIMQKLLKAFPDMKHDFQDVIVSEDKIVVRMTVSGTHTGNLDFVKRPLAATGKRFATSHIHIFRVENGKLAEHWAERDALGQLKQLGLLPGSAS